MIWPMYFHLVAWTRERIGNTMSISSRLEFYINNECVAAFVANPFDYHFWEFGSSFICTPALRQLKFAHRQFNYEKKSVINAVADQFTFGAYDFCAVLKACLRDVEWRIDGMISELLEQIDQGLEPRSLATVMAGRYLDVLR